jgi:hypothetical protein
LRRSYFIEAGLFGKCGDDEGGGGDGREGIIGFYGASL